MEIVLPGTQLEMVHGYTQIYLFQSASCCDGSHLVPFKLETEILLVETRGCEHGTFHSPNEPFRSVSDIGNLLDGIVLVGDSGILGVSHRDVDDRTVIRILCIYVI